MTTLHPRQPNGFGRREFIGRSAAGIVGLSSLSTLLAACGGGDSGSSAADLVLARPDNPVTHPLFDDNPAIASGLDPEQGPLRVYNWNGYIWPKKLKEFGKKYGVDVELSTFSTMDEAISKIATGAVSFDVFFPTTDRLGRMVLAKQLQPLNHDYVPNLAKTIWPALQDPFYDKGSRYTVPYTIYTTGIGYRTDKIAKTPTDYENPYDIFWERKNKGWTWLLDDSREAPSAMLLRHSITDLNTEKPEDIELAKKELLSLVDAVNVKLSTDDYTNLPEGKAWVHQAWSGSMISAQYYLPKGVGTEALGFWFPEDGRGPVGNDQIAVLQSAKNPVLAHHFLNFMLDEKNAYDNFAQFVGYQPPLVKLDPERLVTDEVVPPNLKTAIVRERDFDTGYEELELSPEGQTLWQNAWAEFKAGA
jgi:spermidine/putrescine transport system substrate-binding protein